MRTEIIHKELNTGGLLLVGMSPGKNLKVDIEQIATFSGLPPEHISEEFAGGLKQVRVLYLPKGKSYSAIALIGLGKNPSYGSICDAFRSFSHRLKGRNFSSVCLDGMRSSWTHKNLNFKFGLESALNGFLLGAYEPGLYKSESLHNHPMDKDGFQMKILVAKSKLAPSKAAIAKAEALSSTQKRIFDIVNAPGNKATPEYIANWALKSGEEFGFQVSAMDKQAIEKAGLHALLAVNRGSEFPPYFLILEYAKKSSSKKRTRKIGLVGKGVTFDTGGLSIKPSQNLHYMKSDMGGAAAVLGAFELCAKLQLPVSICGAIPLTDNCVDATSIKPGDVIGSYARRTIEVTDTDAEGRLILADGLAFLNKNYKPDILIDLATLTGSIVRTLGYNAAGLFSNDDDLANQLIEAGRVSGERLWRMPMWDDYKSDIESDVADLKNFSGKMVAGAISAAKFLEVFTSGHPSWAHLDIAGVAFGDSEFSKMKSAKGFGINLLYEFLVQISKEN